MEALNGTPTFRPARKREVAATQAVLAELRAHFKEWTGSEGFERTLLDFAVYEGCASSTHCYEIMLRAAPAALGHRLVERHGFEWVMLQTPAGERLGVHHPKLNEPIDLWTLESGRWNRKRYKSMPTPFQVIHDSYAYIVGQTGGTVGPE
jgi:hypothetical protein